MPRRKCNVPYKPMVHNDPETRVTRCCELYFWIVEAKFRDLCIMRKWYVDSTDEAFNKVLHMAYGKVTVSDLLEIATDVCKHSNEKDVFHVMCDIANNAGIFRFKEIPCVPMNRNKKPFMKFIELMNLRRWAK